MSELSAYTVASVYLLDAPYNIDRRYEYFITGELRGCISPGSFVVLPFGGGNRRCHALVCALDTKSEFPPDKLKPVLSAAGNLSLTAEQLELVEFMREQTFCTAGDAVRAMLPAAALDGLNEYFAAKRSAAEAVRLKNLSPAALQAYNLILRAGRISASRLSQELGPRMTAAVNELVECGYIENAEKSGAGQRFVYFVSLSVDGDELDRLLSGASRPRGARQLDIIETLRERGRMSLDELRILTGATQTQLKALSEKNILTVEKVDSYRNPYNEAPPPPDGNVLNAEQTAAAEKLRALLASGEPKAALLHGITGSGKTRVIIAAIDSVLESGRSVIMLIPEIALTPQTVMLFRSYYGDRVAVLHSALSAGERYDAWRRMKNGDVQICVGTRSAIFAPFDRLGMIVMDEEQESTYKSDIKPRYHARDIARFRCAKQNSLMLLSSATPALESYRKALDGAYSLIELRERWGGAVLPDTELYDMRIETKAGRLSPIGEHLKTEIAANLERGEQTVLFLNRRGYNNFLCCAMCGEVVMCPHCSVALTFHSSPSGGYLMCHYCGHRQPRPSVCPACGSEHVTYQGYGTERVEEELHGLFPDARVIRMDADTTQTKFAYDELLERFRSREGDILLGTQMVVKGHDFPHVTLVGVLNADMALYIEDYRANERTFDLVTQVSGRAGRGETPGRVIIQTYSPDNAVLRLASAQDYRSFYDEEINLRRSLTFPPFCDIMTVTMSCEIENEMKTAAEAYGARLKRLLESEYRDVPMIIFGPFEAVVYKHNGRFRYRFIIKCRSNKRMRELFRRLLVEFSTSAYKRVTTVYDINPTGL